jgi:NADH-quinone oxidoreductase subunit J
METTFYVASTVAVLSTFMVITGVNAVHSLLYLVVSLLAVAVVFYTLGAPFVAALEVIIYAGAIVVLFVFVVMMLNLGAAAAEQERQWLKFDIWLGPSILSAILLAQFGYVLAQGKGIAAGVVGAREVGIALFGPYLLTVELASMLLLAGLVGAYHLGQRGFGGEG